MTQEMYESLAMTDLRAIAKQRGLKVAARAKNDRKRRLQPRADTVDHRKLITVIREEALCDRTSRCCTRMN